MAASHTLQNDESTLLSCSKQILHDYFEKNEITLLIAFIAQDITWTGSGSN